MEEAQTPASAGGDAGQAGDQLSEAECWDPVWKLELRCLQELQQRPGGGAPPSTLLAAATSGKGNALPADLYDMAKADSRVNVFQRFLEARCPHLFRGTVDGDVQLAPGAADFLRLKRDVLQYLVAQHGRRAPARELQARASSLLGAQPALYPEVSQWARTDMALFCRQLLPDCVWVDSYAFCHLRPMKRQESVGTGAELRLPASTRSSPSHASTSMWSRGGAPRAPPVASVTRRSGARAA